MPLKLDHENKKCQACEKDKEIVIALMPLVKIKVSLQEIYYSVTKF